jgi:hypothetical protein
MGSHSPRQFLFELFLVKFISGTGFVVNAWSRNHRNIFTNQCEMFFSQKLSAWNSREIAWNTVNTTNAAWNSVKFREIHFYVFLTQISEFHEISRNFTEFHAAIGICHPPLCKHGYPPIARASVQDLYLWGPLGASGDMVPGKVA